MNWLTLVHALFVVYWLLTVIPWRWEERLLGFALSDLLGGPLTILYGLSLVVYFFLTFREAILVFVRELGWAGLLCPGGIFMILLGSGLTWWRLSHRPQLTPAVPAPPTPPVTA